MYNGYTLVVNDRAETGYLQFKLIVIQTDKNVSKFSQIEAVRLGRGDPPPLPPPSGQPDRFFPLFCCKTPHSGNFPLRKDLLKIGPKAVFFFGQNKFDEHVLTTQKRLHGSI